MYKRFFYWGMLIITVIVFIWSAIQPANRTTWFYEVIPGILSILILLFTYQRFPFTPLTYFFIWIGVLCSFVGAHYTYGSVPLFTTIQEVFHLSRNHFDRLGHFFLGSVIAIVFREIMIRKQLIKRSWLWFLTICIVLALSSAYELFEVFYALIAESNAQQFLGMQGDMWDSHWDIFMAFLGGLLIMIVFSKWHNLLIHNKSFRLTSHPDKS